jgi:predicted Zn-dependent protease
MHGQCFGVGQHAAFQFDLGADIEEIEVIFIVQHARQVSDTYLFNLGHLVWISGTNTIRQGGYYSNIVLFPIERFHMLQRKNQPSQAYRWRRSLFIALLAMVCGYVLAASELPSLGENSAINIERETSLGASVYRRLLAAGLVETNPLLDRYINDIGHRLLTGLHMRLREYRFFIVRDDAVNAFALPGGFIGINRGLIAYAQSQHQLASVMAHEIAHVRLMHGLDMMKKSGEINTASMLTMLAGLLLGTVDSEMGSALLFGSMAGSQQAMVNFTRENEYEADRLGIDLMYQANFDTRGMAEFFTIMGQLSGSSELGDIEYLRTHPVSNNRVAEALARAKNKPGSGDQVDDYPLFKDYLQYVSRLHIPDQGSDYLRALAATRSRAYQQADARLEALYRDSDENIWYGLAYAKNLEYLHRDAEAEKIYRHLLDIFPGDYVLSMQLLRLSNRMGRPQEALDIARRLEFENPGEQQVYFVLSEIYKSLKRPALQMMAEAEFHRLNGNSRQSIRLYDQVLASSDADMATLSKAREKREQLLE